MSNKGITLGSHLSEKSGRIPHSLQPSTSFSTTPADWPRADALIPWQALFEPCELGCPPKTRVRPIPCDRQGVTGFGAFCHHNKGSASRDASGKTSAAGPKPGTTQLSLHSPARQHHARLGLFPFRPIPLPSLNDSI